MLGLDNSGKTTCLKKLADEDVQKITPTQGFNIKSVQKDNFKLNVWDIGGQKHIRPYWSNYYENTDALVYVVDSTDNRRMDEAAEELTELLSNDKLNGVKVLVLANKQDLLGAQTEAQVVESLEITSFKESWIHVAAVSAKTGTGLDEAFEKLIKRINDDKEGKA